MKNNNNRETDELELAIELAKKSLELINYVSKLNLIFSLKLKTQYDT